MAEFNVVEAHQMSVEDATEKLKSFLGNLQGELDQLKVEKESWEGNVLNFAFTYSGQKITGAMKNASAEATSTRNTGRSRPATIATEANSE